MRIAILDLGTNTFNLLVVEKTDPLGYTILLNTKEAVKLGEGGINRRFITEAATQRGIDAVERHYKRMAEFKPDMVKAFATSAIRDAQNGQEFKNLLKEKFGLEIQVIDGNKEAELIYLGVKQTLPFSGKRFIILDIGGGSNEFIIADDNGILWKKSFPLGMARLLEKYNPSDPISPEEIYTIEDYLRTELTELFEKINELQPEIFVGASGSFDSFVKLLVNEGYIQHKNGDTSHVIPMAMYQILHKKLIHSSREERAQMNNLEPVRRDMIVLATIFVNMVLTEANFETVYQSAYSLKEGAVWELIH